MTTRTILRGGCVLTLGTRTPNFSVADVLVDGGRVAEVGTGLRARDAEVIDASNTIVMPGFVDAHRHVWRSLFRNMRHSEADVSAYDADDIYAATLIGLLGAIEAGITTLVDWSDIRPDHVEAALQAHMDAGMRTVFVHTSRDAEFLDRFAAGRQKTGENHTIAFGPDDLWHSDLEAVAGAWTRARELGLRIHAHVGLEPNEKGAVTRLAERGLLGSDVTLIHCTHLSDEELDAISSAGTSVVLTPSTEMTGGMGMPPLQRLLDRRIQPGLGVDDEREAPGDLFNQMRSAISLQHAAYFDLKLAGKAGLPNLLTTRDMIRNATIDGARAIGLGDTTGSLEPGKQADIIVLRTDRPNVYPINDPIGAVVWGIDTSNIEWVFVGGEAVMREGALVADVERATSIAVSSQGRVTSAAGIGSVAGAEERQ